MKASLPLALAAGLATGLICQAQTSYRIAGAVVHADSGNPLPQAHVYLLRSGTAQVAASMTTGEDGRFAFTMPKGAYNLWAGTRMVPQPYGLGTTDDRIGVAIITGPDQDTTHLVLRWFARGAISGKVVDSDGEPVTDALVQLIRSGVVLGRRTNTTLGWTRTNDLGEYRYYSLYPGAYFLAVTGEPWYAKRSGATAPDAGSLPAAAFAPAYYPNTSDISRAAPLKLGAQDDLRADFTLNRVTGATVTVNYNAPGEMRGTIGLVREGIVGKESFQEQQGFSGLLNTYSFFGVPPGRYLLKIAPAAAGPQLECLQNVDVNGSSVTVEADLRPQPQVAGMVQFPGDERPKATVLVVLTPLDGQGTYSATVKADGSFAFARSPAGKYRVTLNLSGVGSYAPPELHMDGGSFHDGIVELSDGATVAMRIRASNELGEIRGLAMRDGKPVVGVMVVLAPVAESSEPTAYHAFKTDSDGSFYWKTVQPGDYLLFATTDTLIEYKNSAALRPYAAKAKTVRLEPKSLLTENISVIDDSAAK